MRCRGEIRADALYTRRGLMAAAGLGREWLLRAKSAGLKSVKAGRSRWYLGRDVIAVMRQGQPVSDHGVTNGRSG